MPKKPSLLRLKVHLLHLRLSQKGHEESACPAPPRTHEGWLKKSSTCGAKIAVRARVGVGPGSGCQVSSQGRGRVGAGVGLDAAISLQPPLQRSSPPCVHYAHTFGCGAVGGRAR